MNRVVFIFQSLPFTAIIGLANCVECNRLEYEYTNDFDLAGLESFSNQLSTKPAELLSCRSRMGIVELNPTHEIMEGVDVVWQIPANPKAILFLVHSRYGTPFSYWPSHPNAPQCIGTPEHVLATKQALARGFAVIAGKSVGDEWVAWPISSAVDVQNFKKILKAWANKHGLQDLPLSAWGTSIGGDFVSSLATVVKMYTLIIMISRGRAEAFESADHGEYPPTLFVPMIKDERTFLVVKENVEILRGKGIPSDIEGAPPLKVHPHFFAENIDEVDEEQSAKLHSIFVESGIVAGDNSLKKVLRKDEVEAYLRKAGILPAEDYIQYQPNEEKEADELQREERSKQASGGLKLGGGPAPSHSLANGVSNQLMVAEGQHTLTSRHNAKVFSWLEGKGWPSVQIK